MTETEMLGEEQVAEIEARDHAEMCGDALYCDCGKVTRDALCSTVRMLREQLHEEQLRNQTQADTIMECEADVTALRDQLAQTRELLGKEIDAGVDLQSQLAQVDKLVDEYVAEVKRELGLPPNAHLSLSLDRYKERIATTMRSRCVQKVRELPITTYDYRGNVIMPTEVFKQYVIRTLESLPLEEQEK